MYALSGHFKSPHHRKAVLDNLKQKGILVVPANRKFSVLVIGDSGAPTERTKQLTLSALQKASGHGASVVFESGFNRRGNAAKHYNPSALYNMYQPTRGGAKLGKDASRKEVAAQSQSSPEPTLPKRTAPRSPFKPSLASKSGSSTKRRPATIRGITTIRAHPRGTRFANSANASHFVPLSSATQSTAAGRHTTRSLLSEFNDLFATTRAPRTAANPINARAKRTTGQRMWN